LNIMIEIIPFKKLHVAMVKELFYTKDRMIV